MADHNNDVFKMYMDEIQKYPMFKSQEEEISTILKAQAGDEAARTKVLQANLRFVVYEAKKYINKGLPIEDLISEGNIGLITALDHFDAKRGYRFISYAVHWIHQSILKALGQKTRTIKLPSNAINEINQINKMVQYYSEKGVDSKDFSHLIANDLNYNEDRVKLLMDLTQDAVSLNVPLSTDEDASDLMSTIADDKIPNQEDVLMEKDLKNTLSKALDKMDSREAEVLRYRFGLENYKQMTLNEIASIYSVTKERIRQIENKAKEHLVQEAGEDLQVYVG